MKILNPNKRAIINRRRLVMNWKAIVLQNHGRGSRRCLHYECTLDKNRQQIVCILRRDLYHIKYDTYFGSMS